MNPIFNKAFFAFMARLAIICNVLFALTVMHMFFKWLKMPDFLANFMAILGLVMSPIANICFVLWLIGIKLKKTIVDIPNWQTFLIVLMLLIQIGAAFI